MWQVLYPIILLTFGFVFVQAAAKMANAGLAVKAKRGRKKAARKTKAVVASVPAVKKSGQYDALFAVKKLANELGGLFGTSAAGHPTANQRRTSRPTT